MKNVLSGVFSMFVPNKAIKEFFEFEKAQSQVRKLNESQHTRVHKMKTLLKKVRAIDKDAADYIESEVLPRWLAIPESLNKVEKMSISDQLSTLIIWSETPQGNGYWRNIYNKLIEGE